MRYYRSLYSEIPYKNNDGEIVKYDFYCAREGLPPRCHVYKRNCVDETGKEVSGTYILQQYTPREGKEYTVENNRDTRPIVYKNYRRIVSVVTESSPDVSQEGARLAGDLIYYHRNVKTFTANEHGYNIFCDESGKILRMYYGLQKAGSLIHTFNDGEAFALSTSGDSTTWADKMIFPGRCKIKVDVSSEDATQWMAYVYDYIPPIKDTSNRKSLLAIDDSYFFVKSGTKVIFVNGGYFIPDKVDEYVENSEEGNYKKIEYREDPSGLYVKVSKGTKVRSDDNYLYHWDESSKKYTRSDKLEKSNEALVNGEFVKVSSRDYHTYFGSYVTVAEDSYIKTDNTFYYRLSDYAVDPNDGNFIFENGKFKELVDSHWYNSQGVQLDVAGEYVKVKGEGLVYWWDKGHKTKYSLTGKEVDWINTSESSHLSTDCVLVNNRFVPVTNLLENGKRYSPIYGVVSTGGTHVKKEIEQDVYINQWTPREMELYWDGFYQGSPRLEFQTGSSDASPLRLRMALKEEVNSDTITYVPKSKSTVKLICSPFPYDQTVINWKNFHDTGDLSLYNEIDAALKSYIIRKGIDFSHTKDTTISLSDYCSLGGVLDEEKNAILEFVKQIYYIPGQSSSELEHKYKPHFEKIKVYEVQELVRRVQQSGVLYTEDYIPTIYQAHEGWQLIYLRNSILNYRSLGTLSACTFSTRNLDSSEVMRRSSYLTEDQVKSGGTFSQLHFNSPDDFISHNINDYKTGVTYQLVADFTTNPRLLNDSSSSPKEYEIWKFRGFSYDFQEGSGNDDDLEMLDRSVTYGGDGMYPIAVSSNQENSDAESYENEELCDYQLGVEDLLVDSLPPRHTYYSPLYRVIDTQGIDSNLKKSLQIVYPYTGKDRLVFQQIDVLRTPRLVFSYKVSTEDQEYIKYSEVSIGTRKIKIDYNQNYVENTQLSSSEDDFILYLRKDQDNYFISIEFGQNYVDIGSVNIYIKHNYKSTNSEKDLNYYEGETYPVIKGWNFRKFFTINRGDLFKSSQISDYINYIVLKVRDLYMKNLVKETSSYLSKELSPDSHKGKLAKTKEVFNNPIDLFPKNLGDPSILTLVLDMYQELYPTYFEPSEETLKRIKVIEKFLQEGYTDAGVPLSTESTILQSLQQNYPLEISTYYADPVRGEGTQSYTLEYNEDSKTEIVADRSIGYDAYPIVRITFRNTGTSRLTLQVTLDQQTDKIISILPFTIEKRNNGRMSIRAIPAVSFADLYEVSCLL